MSNLPRLRRLGQIVAFAFVSASLGACLMLLLSNQKASLEVIVNVDQIVFRVDTRSNY
jgi:hypothetical protein